MVLIKCFKIILICNAVSMYVYLLKILWIKFDHIDLVRASSNKFPPFLAWIRQICRNRNGERFSRECSRESKAHHAAWQPGNKGNRK